MGSNSHQNSLKYGVPLYARAAAQRIYSIKKKHVVGLPKFPTEKTQEFQPTFANFLQFRRKSDREEPPQTAIRLHNMEMKNHMIFCNSTIYK